MSHTHNGWIGMTYFVFVELNYNERINGGGQLQENGGFDAITPSLIFKEIFMV